MTKRLTAKLDNLSENAGQLDDVAHLETADLVQLLRMIRDTADSALTDAVGMARGEGMSWEQVGRWLGTSRQAAHERYAL
jgi:hypothetical protein